MTYIIRMIDKYHMILCEGNVFKSMNGCKAPVIAFNDEMRAQNFCNQFELEQQIKVHATKSTRDYKYMFLDDSVPAPEIIPEVKVSTEEVLFNQEETFEPCKCELDVPVSIEKYTNMFDLIGHVKLCMLHSGMFTKEQIRAYNDECYSSSRDHVQQLSEHVINKINTQCFPSYEQDEVVNM